ncbi:hypothetical protein KXV77_009184, partial [Aspergillus fumigatus]
RDDLQAVGLILSYFYSGAESWEQYQQQRDQETTAPVLTSFLTAVASHKPVDYGILREIFYDAYHDLVLHLEIALDIKGPRAMRDSKLPKMDALAGMKTADLFENLSSTLSHIGRLSGTPMSALPSLTWSELLNTVEEMLRIYMVLVARDRPSSEKKTQ